MSFACAAIAPSSTCLVSSFTSATSSTPRPLRRRGASNQYAYVKLTYNGSCLYIVWASDRGELPFIDGYAESDGSNASTNKAWQRGLAATLAAVVLSTGGKAAADLNKFEADTRGEFGIGSAAQYGSADLRKTVHTGENFRRANFTSADMREADFSNCPFNGAYLEKAVAFKTNFKGADLSDTLMDRMVLNEADLSDAILVRAVLTRSDLGKAIIDGADFSDAVLDLPRSRHFASTQVGRIPQQVWTQGRVWAVGMPDETPTELHRLRFSAHHHSNCLTRMASVMMQPANANNRDWSDCH